VKFYVGCIQTDGENTRVVTSNMMSEVDAEALCKRVNAALAADTPTPVDWQAVARDAAVRIWASYNGTHEPFGDAGDACDAAIALVEKMKRHEAFGGTV
jgi:hypothetical protein